MPARLIMATLLAALLILTSSITAQQRKRTKRSHDGSNQWYVFISPNGEFKISFPDKPNREPDGEGPVTPIQTYGLYTQNGMRFSLNFQGTHGDPDSKLNDEWNDGYEKELLAKNREEKRRVVSSRRIGKNTFEEEIWDSGTDTGEAINYLMQTIVRRGRIYTLLCGSETYGHPLDRPTCRRFLDSLRFIDTSNGTTR